MIQKHTLKRLAIWLGIPLILSAGTIQVLIVLAGDVTGPQNATVVASLQHSPTFGASAAYISRTVTAGAAGVTQNLIAAKDASNPTLYVTAGSGGCGSGFAATTATSGNAFELITVPGSKITAVADGTITAGHVLTGGTSTPGRVADTGATARTAVPVGTCIIGIALASATVGNNMLIAYDGTGIYGASASPTGAAGGDLSGTYPNPTVAKIDGTSVPVNSAANQLLITSASATGLWTTVPNCQDTTGNHLNFNNGTQAFTCGTSQGTISLVFPVTVSGTVTSGGIPYFGSTTQMSSSALLAANQGVFGGGAGTSPFTATSFSLTGSGGTEKILVYNPTATTGASTFVVGQDGSASFGSGHTSAATTSMLIYLGQSQGGTNPFQVLTNNGGANIFSINASGAFNSSSSGTVGGSLSVASTGSLFFLSRAVFKSPADSSISLENNAGTSTTRLTTTVSNTLQLGLADAASPVAQTLGVQSVVAGTSNTAGVNWTINGSAGTGTGAGGSIIFQTAPAGGSGTAQNAFSAALTLASNLSATFGGSVTIPSASLYTFNSRGFLSAPADGTLQVNRNSGAAHIELQVFASSISSGFGTGDTIAGSDAAGRLTVGTIPGTTGVINFGSTWAIAPACIANDETTGVLIRATSSTTQLTLNGVVVAGDKITWNCISY